MTDLETTPQAVWEKQHEYVRNLDADGQAALFAEDAVWELPFAPAGVPKHLEGRAQILAISKAGMERAQQSGRRITGYSDIKIHKTTDQEVIIAEFTLDGDSPDTGAYHTPYIQVVQVRNGKIILLRDYFPGEVLKRPA